MRFHLPYWVTNGTRALLRVPALRKLDGLKAQKVVVFYQDVGLVSDEKLLITDRVAQYPTACHDFYVLKRSGC